MEINVDINVDFLWGDKHFIKNKWGNITYIVGPNGTGKSTLINVILNNLKPQKGYVEYNELQYNNEKTTVKLHQEICAFPDQSELFSFMTGRDHLKLC